MQIEEACKQADPASGRTLQAGVPAEERAHARAHTPCTQSHANTQHGGLGK